MGTTATDGHHDLAAEVAELRVLIRRQEAQLIARGDKIVALRNELRTVRTTLARTRSGKAYRTAMALRRLSSMRNPRHALTVLRRLPHSLKRELLR